MNEKIKKVRLDQLMVSRGLVDSRESAQKLILAGKVRLKDTAARKPGQLVREDASVELLEQLKYVSRGGNKLEHAIETFHIDLSGKVVLDVGASTGGFTDCALQEGARKVFAVDVGYGQIAWKLRQDPRVVLFERANARNIQPSMFDEIPDLAVMDVSFIGAAKILDPLRAVTSRVILLLKPQFEAGPENVPTGGVIRDPSVHKRVLMDFKNSLQGWKILALTASPIEGASGNREFLVHLARADQTDPGMPDAEYQKAVDTLLS